MGRTNAPWSDDGEPVTAPIALPLLSPEARAPVVTRAHDVGAGAVAATVRGAGLMGSVMSAAGRGVAGQVRAEVGSRWPSRPPGAVVVSPSRGGTPWLAVFALVGCAVGVAGLVLPLLEIGGIASLALIDVPYVGMPLLGLFLLLTLMPVVDVLQRRVRWTGWLVVPALIGWAPVALVLFAVPWVPRALHLVWEAAPEEVLGVGAAPMALGGADAILTLVACLAVVARVRTRIRRRESS